MRSSALISILALDRNFGFTRAETALIVLLDPDVVSAVRITLKSMIRSSGETASMRISRWSLMIGSAPADANRNHPGAARNRGRSWRCGRPGYDLPALVALLP